MPWYVPYAIQYSLQIMTGFDNVHSIIYTICILLFGTLHTGFLHLYVMWAIHISGEWCICTCAVVSISYSTHGMFIKCVGAETHRLKIRPTKHLMQKGENTTYSGCVLHRTLCILSKIWLIFSESRISCLLMWVHTDDTCLLPHKYCVVWNVRLMQVEVKLSTSGFRGLRVQSTLLSRVLKTTGHCKCGNQYGGKLCTQPKGLCLLKWIGDYGVAHILNQLADAQHRVHQTEIECVRLGDLLRGLSDTTSAPATAANNTVPPQATSDSSTNTAAPRQYEPASTR
jgi:hypothetical protein